MSNSCGCEKSLAALVAGVALGYVLFRNLKRLCPASQCCQSKKASFQGLLDQAVKSLGDNVIPPTVAKELIKQPSTLLLDVQDGPCESIGGALNISLGTLPFAADASFADGKFKNARLADNKNQTIVVTCGLGGQALIAGKLLKDYGFTNVKVIAGGNKGYADAGCPMK
eukprot:RCo037994